jgi:hypothetical protein
MILDYAPAFSVPLDRTIFARLTQVEVIAAILKGNPQVNAALFSSKPR